MLLLGSVTSTVCDDNDVRKQSGHRPGKQQKAAEQKIKFLKDTSWAPSSHQLLPMVVPMGLSAGSPLLMRK